MCVCVRDSQTYTDTKCAHICFTSFFHFGFSLFPHFNTHTITSTHTHSHTHGRTHAHKHFNTLFVFFYFGVSVASLSSLHNLNLCMFACIVRHTFAHIHVFKAFYIFKHICISHTFRWTCANILQNCKEKSQVKKAMREMALEEVQLQLI